MRIHPVNCLILLIIVTAVPCYSRSFAEIEPTSLTASVGTCVEIRCKVTADLPDEDVLWFWMKDGTQDQSINDLRGTIVYSNKPTERPISPQFEGRVTYTGSTRLTNRASSPNNPSCSVLICDLRLGDSGQYLFRYISKERDFKWSTNKAVITVRENPCPITFNKPEPVKEHQTITLRCSTPTSCSSYLKIESVPPSGLRTSQSAHSYTATASFTPSWKDDGREFTCQTQGNKDKQLMKKTTISVQYAPLVEVRVSPPPHRQGQTLRLSCNVIRSNPPPLLYSWYKNEQRLSGGQTYVKTLQPEDSGSYKCSAENTVGSAQSGPLQIDVQYKPTNINIETQTKEVAVGSSVTFRCHSDANPPPHTYSWYKQRVSLQSSAENSLELKSVQRTDEGCYRCGVSNRLGSDSSTDLCIQVLFPPTRLTLSMDTEVTEGQSVSITCAVDSSPVSTLTLSRTSQGSPEELLKDTEHNSLSFSVTVSSVHSGEYTCSAHNSVGSDSTKRSLKVKYRPQNVRVQADPGLMVKENTTLTLHCSAQSHPPVSSVTWSRGPTGQGPPVHSGPTFSVKSVSVNDSGLYSCTAHNQVGQATSPPAPVTVTFGPKQAVVLRAEEVQGPDGSRSVTLSCSSHSVPPVSLYTWYRRTEDRELKVSENINYTVLSTQPGVYYCTAKNSISESTSEPVSLFQTRGFVKFIFLALVPLLIILCAFLLYRLKIKRSVDQERAYTSWWRSCSKAVGQWHSSRGRTHHVPAETPRRPDVPGPQPRADIKKGKSNASAVYATVHLPKHKQGRPATRDPNTCADSLFYVTLQFDKTKATLPPKESEDVIYSTVKKHDEEVGDVYENITKVQKAKCSNASDSSEDEEDVNYSRVNFRSKARSREETRVTSTEVDYSELNF